MNKTSALSLVLLGALAFLPAAAFADLTKAQRVLAQDGYYSGAADGVMNDATAKALRSYQLRNGLPITGQLDGETSTALTGTVGVGTPAPGPVMQDDQNFLRENLVEQPTPSPGMDDFSDLQAPGNSEPPGVFAPIIEPPNPVARPTPAKVTPKVASRPAPTPTRGISQRTSSSSSSQPGVLTDLFQGSPYATMNSDIQRQVLRDAQRALNRSGYYNGSVDGIAGPNTRNAISAFQRRNNLAATGRLDYVTLQSMGLGGSGPGGDPKGGGPSQNIARSQQTTVVEGSRIYTGVAVGPPPVVFVPGPIFIGGGVRFWGPRSRVVVNVGRRGPRRGGVVVFR